eukprot:RCo045622
MTADIHPAPSASVGSACATPSLLLQPNLFCCLRDFRFKVFFPGDDSFSHSAVRRFSSFFFPPVVPHAFTFAPALPEVPSKSGGLCKYSLFVHVFAVGLCFSPLLGR